MNKRDFYGVSILGMVAYCVMCLESYALEAYPGRDLAPVLRLAWGIVGPDGYIDENAYRYMEGVPEYLFEFGDYEAAELEYLTRDEFDELRSMLNPDDEMLGLLMHRIYDVAMCYAYTAVETSPKEAVDLVFDVVDCLGKHGIQLPDFELVRGFAFSEFHGWGAHISPEGLSRII
ncbi:MAG: hypothetical protein IKE22_09870 [Atopobiaceae bacterium]|nr:hypothetical protein [Atopobiaceae bacterium]